MKKKLKKLKILKFVSNSPNDNKNLKIKYDDVYKGSLCKNIELNVEMFFAVFKNVFESGENTKFNL